MAAPPGGQFPSMISQPSAPAYGAQGMMSQQQPTHQVVSPFNAQL
jgi:hypothetical protein